MRRDALIAAFSLATIVAGAVLAPTAALADGRRGRGGSPRVHTVPPQRFFPQRFFHGTRTISVAPPLIGYGYGYGSPAYATPAYVPPPPDYPPAYAPSAGYAPSPGYAPPSSYAPSPMQTVIEFPNGRYVLQGDGVGTPYRWVWIPNPPTSPPVDESPGPSAAPLPPPRRTDIYRWTDSDGAVHLTDRWDKVPEAYRSKATKS